MRLVGAFCFAGVCFAVMGMAMFRKREEGAEDHTLQSPLRLTFAQKSA